jgi:hypothetical protein
MCGSTWMTAIFFKQLTLWSPAVTICTICTICTTPHNSRKLYVPPTGWIYVCCMDRKKTAIISLHNSKWFKKSDSTCLPSAPRLPKEHIPLESSQASPVCPSGKKNTLMKVSREHWWNNNGREKQKYSTKNLFQCHFVHHKSHIDWPVYCAVRTESLNIT